MRVKSDGIDSPVPGLGNGMIFKVNQMESYKGNVSRKIRIYPNFLKTDTHICKQSLVRKHILKHFFFFFFFFFFYFQNLFAESVK